MKPEEMLAQLVKRAQAAQPVPGGAAVSAAGQSAAPAAAPKPAQQPAPQPAQAPLTDWASIPRQPQQQPQPQQPTNPQQYWTPEAAPGLTQRQRNVLEYDIGEFRNQLGYPPASSQMQERYGGITDRDSAGEFLGPMTGHYLNPNYGQARALTSPENMTALGVGAGEIGLGIGSRFAPGLKPLLGPAARLTPWAAYLDNPIDDQGNIGGAMNAAYTGGRYLQGMGQGLNVARNSGGGLSSVLNGGRQALGKFNPATGAGRGLATRWAAPLYLGADAANELWHSTNEGYTMGATNPLQAFGYGFDARTDRTRGQQADWADQDTGLGMASGYAGQVLENSGKPLQMLYAGAQDIPGVIGDYTVGSASRGLANRRIDNQGDAASQQSNELAAARNAAAANAAAENPGLPYEPSESIPFLDRYSKVRRNVNGQRVHQWQNNESGWTGGPQNAAPWAKGSIYAPQDYQGYYSPELPSWAVERLNNAVNQQSLAQGDAQWLPPVSHGVPAEYVIQMLRENR